MCVGRNLCSLWIFCQMIVFCSSYFPVLPKTSLSPPLFFYLLVYKLLMYVFQKFGMCMRYNCIAGIIVHVQVCPIVWLLSTCTCTCRSFRECNMLYTFMYNKFDCNFEECNETYTYMYYHIYIVVPI